MTSHLLACVLIPGTRQHVVMTFWAIRANVPTHLLFEFSVWGGHGC